MKDEEIDAAIEQMCEQMEDDGVSVTSVTDGHVLMFKRSKLEEIVKGLQNEGQESCIIVVKNQKPVDKGMMS